MSLPVLIGFTGVLVAAVATGMLAGRCVRQPRIAFIAWTAATLALTAALAAESTGFARGFGPATFRAVQLFALLLAPLWLAWGLAEQLWPSEAARFGARLACGALTVIGSVILATDPLTARPFGKSWPLGGQHYQSPSHYALDAAQAVAVISTAVTVGLAAAWARSDRRRRGALEGAALIGLAVLLIVIQRFSLPAKSLYPLFSLAAAALVWFGATRLESLADRAGRDRAAVRDRRAGRDRPDARDRRDGRDDRGREPAGHEAPQVAPNGYAGPDDGGPDPPGEPGDAGGRPDPGRRPAPPPAAPPARPYGRILIFTLLDDRVADFDWLAEQTAEEVRIREPDTLVYVIHLVPNAPMQRIFYEIYRNRAAFDSHERQPYMQRFAAERRSCVLATNVIELRLKYAKVAPLPNPQPSAPPAPPGPAAPSGPAAPPQAGQPQPSQAAQAGQALEPLPPAPGRPMPSSGGRHGGT